MTPFPILLVEDDPNDVYFFQRAIAKAGLGHVLHIVQDGQQAINYLAGTAPFADPNQHPLPRLIVLDLNLPVKHGLEVLKWLRGNPETEGSVVLVLTSSSSELDIDEAYRLGANAYLVKPADPTELAGMVNAIKGFWFECNQWPPFAEKPKRT